MFSLRLVDIFDRMNWTLDWAGCQWFDTRHISVFEFFSVTYYILSPEFRFDREFGITLFLVLCKLYDSMQIKRNIFCVLTQKENTKRIRTNSRLTDNSWRNELFVLFLFFIGL